MLQGRGNNEELVRQLKLGNEVAYDLLYEQYWKKLYIHVLSRVKDEDAAKDIVQNVFISIWERKDSFQIHTSLDQFLFGAVKMKVLNYFRTEKMEERVMEYTLQKLERATVSIHELSDYYDLEKLIETEIKELPENMRNAYLMRNAHLSTSEIAEKLNLAEQTVSNHVSEAMRRLRKKLGDKFPERMII
ncbi:RNA polymerase sigma factor [compost metagenome]